MQKLKLGDAEVGILARLMRKVDFFAPLTVGQIEQILPFIMLYSYGAGENVFKQGETGDAFYIVYKGKVGIKVKKGFFSFAKQVAQLGEGDFFGEIALISRDKRGATVQTLEPTQLFVLVAGDFEFILKQNPQTAAEMKKLADRRTFASQHAGGTER
jgi:CRP-like cAMP-binding protein